MTNNQAGPKVEDPGLRLGPGWPPPERTGVRLVLANATDPSRENEYRTWCADYENAIIRPGVIANALRFENPDAAGTETDPRVAEISDLATQDPASAWPATENSPDYPTPSSPTPEANRSLQGSAAPTR